MPIHPTLLLLLVACLYILVFGGLSIVRREGLSVHFAIEVLMLTTILVGGGWLLGVQLTPFAFLLILYLITMRSRLIVDLANLLAQRGKYVMAFRLYRLGLGWWPDRSSRLIVLSNRGAAELHSGQVEGAIQTLETVLEPQNRACLGVKYETGTRYNLGLAYERHDEPARARQQYNEVIDLLPGSVYAQAARGALQRLKETVSKN